MPASLDLADNPGYALLASALEGAKRRYARQNPQSYENWKDAASSMPGGNTRTVLYHDPFPICMVKGEGCRLIDADGHSYIDLLGEYTAGIFGHSNPILAKAIAEAVDNGVSLSAHNSVEAKLAHEICRRFDSIELIRFTNSGTEANLMAIATAIAFTGRRKIIVFDGSYHGGLLMFGGGKAPTNVPHEFVVLPYNDISAARAAVVANATELAAILVEPMLGAGGCIPGDPEFLRCLADLSRTVGAVLIFDEIQTSRLSRGGRQELLALKPDMTTLGKYFGGGLSFGAFGGRGDLMSLYDPRRPEHLKHAGTFNNNVLSMAAGYAGLSEVLTEDALRKVNRRGDDLRERINELFARHGARFLATGLGSILNIHSTGDVSSARLAVDLLFFELLERGFYCAPRGLIALSLPVGDEEINGFLAALQDVLRDRRFEFCANPSSPVQGCPAVVADSPT